MRKSVLRYPRNLRGAELQLLVTVLLFFAAGYLLVVNATKSQEFIPTVRGVADILWPSVLPFLLFLAISICLALDRRRPDYRDVCVRQRSKRQRRQSVVQLWLLLLPTLGAVEDHPGGVPGLVPERAP